jgi:hypothetical protein
LIAQLTAVETLERLKTWFDEPGPTICHFFPQKTQTRMSLGRRRLWDAMKGALARGGAAQVETARGHTENAEGMLGGNGIGLWHQIDVANRPLIASEKDESSSCRRLSK